MPKRTASVPSEIKARAKQLRERLKDRPGLHQLLSSEELADATPFYLVLRTFVAELKNARQQRGQTLVDVAQKTGLAVETLSRLETGALVNPTWQTLACYAAAVGCHIRMHVETAG